MENKLEEAITARDWYSAHQLLISLAQRHQRAKRVEEAKNLLIHGLKSMCPVTSRAEWPPLATILDISEKFVEISEATGTPSALAEDEVELEKDRCAAIFETILLACDAVKETDDKHAGCWADLSSRLLTLRPGYAGDLFNVLMATPVLPAWQLHWAVMNQAQNREAYGKLAPLLTAPEDCEHVAVAALQLLGVKSFGGASALLSGVVSALRDGSPAKGHLSFTSIDDSAGTLPSFLALVSGQNGAYELLNFAQLVFVLCQRRNPPKTLFVQLAERFRVANDETFGRLMGHLTKIYCPAPKAPAQNQMNPLASMFANMFGPGGMPGGMPNMPGTMPPQSGARKSTNKKTTNPSDLD